jgi:phosphopantothenoylcysteine decarboxylase/phosphopantothenate--cysteine ligase
MAAAVSDFIPEFINEKMDRKKGPISVNLTPNQDILKNITKKFPNVTSIGFSAQINDNLNFKKIKDKNVNFLVINNISKNKIGSDLNQINLINQNELIVSSDRLDKRSIAKLIIDYTIE